MNLNDMLHSNEFKEWEICSTETMDKNNPDRYNRCREAAEQGADGSTHAETMQDWIAFLNISENSGLFFTKENFDSLKKEINECWEWHDKHGSLHEEVG